MPWRHYVAIDIAEIRLRLREFRLQSDRTLQRLDGLMRLALRAIGDAQIIQRICEIGVKCESTAIGCDCAMFVAERFQCCAEIIEHVRRCVWRSAGAPKVFVRFPVFALPVIDGTEQVITGGIKRNDF